MYSNIIELVRSLEEQDNSSWKSGLTGARLKKTSQVKFQRGRTRESRRSQSLSQVPSVRALVCFFTKGANCEVIETST